MCPNRRTKKNRVKNANCVNKRTSVDTMGLSFERRRRIQCAIVNFEGNYQSPTGLLLDFIISKSCFVTQVNPGSPAHNKLDHGDVVTSIGNYSALHLKHEEALNIIRLFEYHLPLCIKRYVLLPWVKFQTSIWIKIDSNKKGSTSCCEFASFFALLAP